MAPNYVLRLGEIPIMLTARETDVLRLLSGGCTYKTIAERLGISLHTVGSHTKNSYRKLEVHTAAGAVMRAAQLGLLGPTRSLVWDGRHPQPHLIRTTAAAARD